MSRASSVEVEPGSTIRLTLGSKKLPEAKLAEKLAKGAEAVKAVYRSDRHCFLA